jgi:hypothetical protein
MTQQEAQQILEALDRLSSSIDRLHRDTREALASIKIKDVNKIL